MTGPSSLIGDTRVWPGPARPDATLGRMYDMVMNEYQNSHLVATAADIADEVDGKDNAAMAAALVEWMRVHTRFVPDPIRQQLLKSPLYMLEVIHREGKIAGDCVDIAMLSAALAMAVGLSAKFVAESYASPCNPITSPLVHVYTVIRTQDGWVAADTQQPPNGIPHVPCRRVELDLA